MTTKRIKPTPIQSRAEMEQLVGEITTLIAQQQAITGARDTALTLLKASYEEQLKPMAEGLKGKLALAQEWAEANTEAFGKARSLAMAHGTVGFRTNPHSVALLNRQWNWDKVLAKMQELGGWAKRYVRQTPEVNKAQILLDREKVTAETFAELGIKIVQGDDFYITPNVTSVETRLKEAA